MPSAPLLVAGRWLEPDDGPAVVLRKGTADDNNILIGDTIRLDLGELGDSDWQVIGFYEDVFEGVGETDPIYANLDAVFAATKKQNQGSQVRVFTDFHSEPYVQQVANDLKDLYEANSVDVSDSLVMLENRRNADSQFSIIISMMLVLAIIMALVGGIGLMGALSISVVERTREIGVMRAVGAKTPTILGMFVMEGILQGLLSWIIVIPISFVLGRPLANALGLVLFDATLDYQYNFSVLADLFTLILAENLKKKLKPHQVAQLMMTLKLFRSTKGFKADNYHDLSIYNDMAYNLHKKDIDKQGKNG